MEKLPLSIRFKMLVPAADQIGSQTTQSSNPDGARVVYSQQSRIVTDNGSVKKTGSDIFTSRLSSNKVIRPINGISTQAMEANIKWVESEVRKKLYDNKTTIYNMIIKRVGYASADDIWQQVELIVYNNQGSLDLEKNIQAWFMTVAHNRCFDELRQRKHRFSNFADIKVIRNDEEVSPIDIVPDNNPLPDEVVESKEMSYRLHLAIQDLPPSYRRVVTIRSNTGQTFREIGEILHITESSAKTLYRRALPFLRKALADLEGN